MGACLGLGWYQEGGEMRMGMAARLRRRMSSQNFAQAPFIPRSEWYRWGHLENAGQQKTRKARQRSGFRQRKALLAKILVVVQGQKWWVKT